MNKEEKEVYKQMVDGEYVSLQKLADMEAKGEIDVKRYYSIKDCVSNDFCDMFVARNHASALRSFNHTLARQLKDGVITCADDYELYYVGKAVVYKGYIDFYKDIQKVYDNEENNKES